MLSQQVLSKYDQLFTQIFDMIFMFGHLFLTRLFFNLGEE